MDAATRGMVRNRAGQRCEYCQLKQQQSELMHHVEHIVAKQHGGSDDPSNLALACHRCNLHKGPNLSGVDPVTGQIEQLFHPRRDQWLEHFVWDGVRIQGISAAGRATVHALKMNDPRRLELRNKLNKG
jgi:hypothetical protein